MTRTRKILLGLLVVLLLGGGLLWLNRQAILLFYIANFTHEEVAPNRPIDWQEGPTDPSAPPAERPPNIVVILADDLGINDISTFGGGVAGGRVPTPNIDRLARSGAVFTQGYAGNATCAPSRAMLMTGRYPTRTGFEFTPTPPGMSRIVPMLADEEASGLPPIERNDDAGETPPFAEQGLPGSEVTIAEMLSGAGYHTVHIGKWHLGRGEEFGPNAQGFDESLLMASGMYLPEDHPDVVNARLDFDPIDRFLWARMQYAASFNDGDWFEPGGYLTDWWTDEAVRVIRANRNRPFFLYLAHWGTHTPLQATRADYEAVGDIRPHRLRVYAAMVRALDRSVGRIVDELEAQGLLENTIILFSSDNGGPGYIGLEDINAPYRGWKVTFFEGGIRVPFFLSWPGRIAPGTTSDTPVAHIDVAPTLAGAAGAPLPEGVIVDGIDLMAEARGGGALERPGDALYWQSGYYRVVRQGDWKLQVDDFRDRVWLYNLEDDPTEQNNLAERLPDRVAALRALIEAHAEDARPPLYPYQVRLPVAVDRTLAERAGPEDEIVYWPN